MSSYWDEIDKQISLLKEAKTVDAVLTVLGAKGQSKAFFGGDGDEMLGALYDAGWRGHRYAAAYYWVLRSPEGDECLSYTEGDVHRGDNPMCAEEEVSNAER